MKFTILKLLVVTAVLSVIMVFFSMRQQDMRRNMSITFVSDNGGKLVYDTKGANATWSLQSVELVSANIKNADLVHLRRINPPQLLDLSDNKIDDDGLHQLYGISTRNMNLSGTAVTRSGVIALLDNSQCCSISWDGETLNQTLDVIEPSRRKKREQVGQVQ